MHNKAERKNQQEKNENESQQKWRKLLLDVYYEIT